MSNFKTIILTIISLFAAIALFAAESFPSPEDGGYHFVHDYAGVLSDSDKSNLEGLSEEIEDSLYVQIATVLMDTLSSDTNIDDYATDLFMAWGIGSKKTDGGVLILCVMNSHEVVIRTGYGVEGALTDAACISIINNKIAPNFREGNYYQGLEKALVYMAGILMGEFTAEDVASEEDDDVNWLVVGIILIVIFVLPLFLPKRYRSAYYAFLLDVVISAIFRGGGGGSSSGGGGGRSYGGGSTGGGGARGSW